MPLREGGHGCLETILSKLSEPHSWVQQLRPSGQTTTPQTPHAHSPAASKQPCERGGKTALLCFGEEGGGEGILTNPIYFHQSNVASAGNYSCINLYNLYLQRILFSRSLRTQPAARAPCTVALLFVLLLKYKLPNKPNYTACFFPFPQQSHVFWDSRTKQPEAANVSCFLSEGRSYGCDILQKTYFTVFLLVFSPS